MLGRLCSPAHRSSTVGAPRHRALLWARPERVVLGGSPLPCNTIVTDLTMSRREPLMTITRRSLITF